MLKVPPPSATVVLRCHHGQVGVSGPWMKAWLGLCCSRCGSRGSIGCRPSPSSWVTDWSAFDAPSPGLRPSMVRDGLAGCRSDSVWGGLSCQSPPHWPPGQLYCLLVQSSRLAWPRLMNWQCSLGSARHLHRWCQGLLTRGLLTWGPWAYCLSSDAGRTSWRCR